MARRAAVTPAGKLSCIGRPARHPGQRACIAGSRRGRILRSLAVFAAMLQQPCDRLGISVSCSDTALLFYLLNQTRLFCQSYLIKSDKVKSANAKSLLFLNRQRFSFFGMMPLFIDRSGAKPRLTLASDFFASYCLLLSRYCCSAMPIPARLSYPFPTIGHTQHNIEPRAEP